MLRTPRTFREIARVGPIRRQTERVHELLADAGRTAYLAVALAEEMPVNETLEIGRTLPELVGGGLEAIVVNGLYPQRFSQEEMARIEQVPADEVGDDVRRALAAARAEHHWTVGQQEQLERLRQEGGAPVLTLPFLFAKELRLPELRRLADELAAQL
jgi:hypothetical protein